MPLSLDGVQQLLAVSLALEAHLNHVLLHVIQGNHPAILADDQRLGHGIAPNEIGNLDGMGGSALLIPEIFPYLHALQRMRGGEQLLSLLGGMILQHLGHGLFLIMTGEGGNQEYQHEDQEHKPCSAQNQCNGFGEQAHPIQVDLQWENQRTGIVALLIAG